MDVNWLSSNLFAALRAESAGKFIKSLRIYSEHFSELFSELMLPLHLSISFGEPWR